MNKIILSIALISSACVLPDDVTPGGDTHDEDTIGETAQEVTSANGISLNGISLNGISLNGISLNGISLNGISLNGISLNGTSISAMSTTAPPLTGAAVVGSTWNGTAANGTAVKLRIDVAVAGSNPNPDLWFYKVSYQTSSGWTPLCGLDGAGQAIQAVTVAGVWTATAADSALYQSSTTQFTFACRGKTIAKCVELGYKTFKGRTTQMASCVRLLRGDYCGTGVAYTVDGTTLNLYDNVGVQADTQVWKPEAEWTPTGARCINSSNAARYNLALSKDPKCVKPLKTATCGTTFANGAVLIDELP
jgi:ADYC domain